MPDRFAYDVFLSHSSKDKPAVLALAERLASDGVTVWLDDWGIAPGEHIPSALEKGLRESRHLVLCMSVNGLGSDWVKAETWTALFSDPLNQGRRVLPLRLDDVTVTGFLGPLKAIDWRDQSDAEYQKLLTACRAASHAPPPPPARQPVQCAPDASPACRALAKILSQPGLWPALIQADIIRKLEQQLVQIKYQHALPDAQALYELCAQPGASAERLLRRMSAALTLLTSGASAPVLRDAIIAIGKVLAERYLGEQAAQAVPTLTHEVTVPIASEALATLIAAIWINQQATAGEAPLAIAMVVENGMPKTLNALNITNTPLEPGCRSALDLIKKQVDMCLAGRGAVTPGGWQAMSNEDLLDQFLPELASRFSDSMQDGNYYDLILTLNLGQCGLDHLLSDPATRASIKTELNLWTVLYNGNAAQQSAVQQLARTIQTTFEGFCKYL